MVLNTFALLCNSQLSPSSISPSFHLPNGNSVPLNNTSSPFPSLQPTSHPVPGPWPI